MPIHWAIDQNRHGMSARSATVLTVWRSEGVKGRETMGAYSRKIYIPEPIVDVHKEENNSRLRHDGRQSLTTITIRSAHLEVPRNFLFPHTNQSLGIAGEFRVANSHL